jgi:hypothetical protein
VDTLRAIHAKAAAAYEKHGEEQRYYHVLEFFLGVHNSVPMVPQVGLIPKRGDILYWGGSDHVAISLGRIRSNGEPKDHLMSLWHHRGGTFSQITLEEMPHSLPRPNFRPCPFPLTVS